MSLLTWSSTRHCFRKILTECRAQLIFQILRNLIQVITALANRIRGH